MKNLLLLLSVAAIFASSCSSKIGIAKRKYGKGYYVAVSHKPKTQNQMVSTLKKENSSSTETVARVVVNKSEEVLKTNEAQPLVAKAKHDFIQPNVERESSRQIVAQASVQTEKTFEKSSVIKPLSSSVLNKVSASKKADDTNTILLVILCLFWWLNLVAVYLHQGKKITTDFWITLVLDLTIILGIIYSILVVLDVLSFA